MLKGGTRAKLSLPVRYGVVVHPTEGAVLIDTGYGPNISHGADRGRALRIYNALLGPELNPAGAHEPVLARLGLTRADVRHVIVTHFHVDHVCELSHYPSANIIGSGRGLRGVRRGATFANLRHGLFNELVPDDVEARFTDVETCPEAPAPLGLGAGRDLFGDGSLLAIDLPGHAVGHFGLCFPDLSTPLLYAVDTQWLLRAVTEARVPGFPPTLIADDARALVRSAGTVAEFANAGGEIMLCHDPDPQAYDLPDEAHV